MISVTQTDQGLVTVDIFHEEGWGHICDGHNIALLSGVGSAFTFPVTVQGKRDHDAQVKVTVEWVSSTRSS